MSAGFFSINIDRSDIDQMATVAHATDAQIETARTRALRKMRAPIEKAIKAEAAKRLRIPQRAIEDRFYSNRVEEGDEQLTIWIGTWAVSPFSIGAPSQTPGGVRVGRRFYRGAWLGQVYTPQEKVWIRLHSKHFSREMYPTRLRAGDRGLARDHRFPVVRAAIPIDAVIAQVLARDGAEFGRRFLRLFEQELNYEANVKGVQ